MKSSSALILVRVGILAAGLAIVLALFGVVPQWAPLAALVFAPIVVAGLAISFGAITSGWRRR